MSPDQIALFTAVLAFLGKMGGWPIWIFVVLIVIGPWALALALAMGKRSDTAQYRDEMAAVLARYKEDMAEMRRMYESNVKLVEETQMLAKDLKDVVMVNTQTFSQLTDAIKHNQFCPIVRKEGGMG